MRMFRILSLPLLVLLCGLLSCGHRHSYPWSLLVADSLADVRPDSALACLRLLEDSARLMPRPDSMYYALLKIKATDKAYIARDTTDGILDIVRYYEGEGDRRLLPMAYYYAASTYRDMNMFADAMDYFYAAIAAAEEYGDGRRILALSHSQIAGLYSLHRMYGAAKDACRMAFHYDSLAGFDTGVIYECIDLGQYYFCLGKKDSAMAYYYKGLDMARKDGNRKLQAIASSQLARAYMDLGQYGKAGPLIDFALDYDDPQNRSSVYSIASDYYEATGRKGEALDCYKLLVRIGNIYGRQAAYDMLGRYYLSVGLQDSASYYSGLGAMLADSIKDIKKVEAIADKKFLYSVGSRPASSERGFAVYGVVLSAMLLSAGCIYGFRRWVKSKSGPQAQSVGDAGSPAPGGAPGGCGDVVPSGCDCLSPPAGLAGDELRAWKDARLSGLPVVVKMKSRLNDKTIDWEKSPWRMTHEDWTLLDNGVNGVCRGFKETLVRKHSLSEREYKVCLLIRVGVNPSAIARLLFCTSQSVSNIRARLYEKCFHAPRLRRSVG